MKDQNKQIKQNWLNITDPSEEKEHPKMEDKLFYKL